VCVCTCVVRVCCVRMWMCVCACVNVPPPEVALTFCHNTSPLNYDIHSEASFEELLYDLQLRRANAQCSLFTT
jgi:hypothetical protein